MAIEPQLMTTMMTGTNSGPLVILNITGTVTDCTVHNISNRHKFLQATDKGVGDSGRSADEIGSTGG